MSDAIYETGQDVLSRVREEIHSGKPPTSFKVGKGELDRIQVGPRLVTLLGGAPGSGKTALAMQCVIDALRFDTELRACVCNVEMSPDSLVERQVARLSGIELTTLRSRQIDAEYALQLANALETLETVVERLVFVRPPFNLATVAETAEKSGAELILLDYIQRIPPPGPQGDRRGTVDAAMSYLRGFADRGAAVIVIAAVSRSKDRQGRPSYSEGLNLASFRESSELEFGADDAFLLLPDTDQPREVRLRHLKSRYGEMKDIQLRFDGRVQRFSDTSTSPY